MRCPGRNPASGYLACASGRPFFFADKDGPWVPFSLRAEDVGLPVDGEELEEFWRWE